MPIVEREVSRDETNGQAANQAGLDARPRFAQAARKSRRHVCGRFGDPARHANAGLVDGGGNDVPDGLRRIVLQQQRQRQREFRAQRVDGVVLTIKRRSRRNAGE